MSLKESIKSIGEKVDKVALSKAVALMLMSWLALPIVYWLIVKDKKNKNVPEEKEEIQEKETEK